MHVPSLCVLLRLLLLLLLFLLFLLLSLFVFFLLAFLLSMSRLLFVLLGLFWRLNPEQLLRVPLVTDIVSIAGMSDGDGNLPFELGHH